MSGVLINKDLNTKYCHMFVKWHQAKRLTFMLENNHRQWVKGVTDLNLLVSNYFSWFFESTMDTPTSSIGPSPPSEFFTGQILVE